MANKKRLIDANALNKKKKYCFQTVGGCFPKSEWFIKADDLFDAPTVDAVKVVRCKDCKNYVADGLWCNSNCCVGENHANWYPDDFCSYGVNKNEDLSL